MKATCYESHCKDGVFRINFFSIFKGKEMRKVLLFTMVALVASMCFAATITDANMYYKYNLLEKAKESYIDVILNGKDSEKAEAYYQLGNVVYEENNLSLALETWNELITKYPNSSYATIVKERISVLKDVIGETGTDLLNNAVAKSYLKNGDFWSKGKDSVFSIDSSWIGNVEAAMFWYQKVIDEYPKTSAAETAYSEMLKTILGWQASKYTSYGIAGDFKKWMPIMLEKFAAFEKDFPEASTLQAFRYQIAQCYWDNKDWANTRLWLNKIIAASSGDSFYKDLAERRLQKVEY